jgi:hypothetical protein
MKRLRAHLGLLLLVSVLASACSTVCDKEKLPHAGDLSKPEHTAAILQYGCRNECWSEIYDLASEKTRAEYGYVKFRVGFPDLKAPGKDETIRALIARTGEILVMRSHIGEKYRLALMTIVEGGKDRDLNVLLLLEGGEWHVALQEQVEKKVAFTDW